MLIFQFSEREVLSRPLHGPQRPGNCEDEGLLHQ